MLVLIEVDALINQIIENFAGKRLSRLWLYLQHLHEITFDDYFNANKNIWHIYSFL